jgi:hypothetical protein
MANPQTQIGAETMTTTKRLWAYLILLACLTAAPALAATGQPAAAGQMSGYLVTYQGNRLEVVRFNNLLPDYTFRYQGVIQTLPLNKIKSLAIKGGGVLLERRDGVTIKVTGSMAISATTSLDFVFKDAFGAEEQEGHLDPMLVSLIVFN